MVARRLRNDRDVRGPCSRWHPDEMFVLVAGRQMYLWRAFDGEGEVLGVAGSGQRGKVLAVACVKRRHTAAPEPLIGGNRRDKRCNGRASPIRYKSQRCRSARDSGS